MKRGLVVAILIIGLGLIAAPAMFQMFTRAPGGGDMIDAFRPYMTDAKVTQFQGYMVEINQAEHENVTKLPALLASAKVSQAQVGSQYQYVVTFDKQWPSIYSDMYDNLLSKMKRMVPNYQAVAALPPFWMFPWFFVLPGLIIAILAALALRADRRPRGARQHLTLLAVFGVAIILAPAVFQMFTRAPKGAQMINTFKAMPFNSTELAKIQNDFVVIGAAEGVLRTGIEPLLLSHGVSPQQLATQLPMSSAWHRDWPTISANMAPMIGVMADEVSHFEGVAALPPFWLFPWFFVLPGLLVAGLALEARRGTGTAATARLASRQTSVRAPDAPVTR